MSEYKPDLICIAELWDMVRKLDREVNLTGYNKRSKPTTDQRRSLLIFIKMVSLFLPDKFILIAAF